MTKTIKPNSILTLILILYSPLSIGEEFEVTQATKSDIIARISAVLEEQYIFPERGKIAIDELNRRLETGYFDSIDDPQTFAFRITGVLDIISDPHLWINYHPTSIPTDYNHLEPSQAELEEQAELQLRRNFGIEKVERLGGNLGYIELREFQYEAGLTEKVLANAMEFLQHTDGLIIDLRRNGGGHPEMVPLILSYLLSEETLAVQIRYREENRIAEFWTRSNIQGPHYNEQRPVYVLTSENTFSTAESLSYILQARGRAKIVGERTRGGANPFYYERLHEHFMIAVPVGTSIEPSTQSNWLYVGVRPDHTTQAKSALTAAHRLILEEQVANNDDSAARSEKEYVLRQIANGSANPGNK